MRKRLLLVAGVLGLALPLLAQAAAGDLDPSFGVGGKVVTGFSLSSSDEARGVALMRNGKIVAAGISGSDFGLARYNRDGSLDSSFGLGGKVLTSFSGSSGEIGNAIAVQRNGKILMAGESNASGSTDFAIARYRRNGSLDPNFGYAGRVLTHFSGAAFAIATAVTVARDGKIVAAGWSGVNTTQTAFALVRYNPDGSLDSSFGSGGIVLTKFSAATGEHAKDVVISRNGKIIVAGSSLNGVTEDFALARYRRNGSLDPSFGSGGKVLTHFGSSTFDEGNAVALERSGKIIAAGDADGRWFAVARYKRDGSLDRKVRFRRHGAHRLLSESRPGLRGSARAQTQDRGGRLDRGQLRACPLQPGRRPRSALRFSRRSADTLRRFELQSGP